MRMAVIKLVLVTATLSAAIAPLRAEVRILASPGGQVGPFLDLFDRLRDSGEMPPTVVLTAYGNVETAVRTVHELGAYWFLEKPIQPASLEVLLRRAGNHAGLRKSCHVGFTVT